METRPESAVPSMQVSLEFCRYLQAGKRNFEDGMRVEHFVVSSLSLKESLCFAILVGL